MHRKSQFATDYLVIIGVGMVVLAAVIFVLYAYYFGSSTNTSSNALELSTNQLKSSIDQVYAESSGAQASFYVEFPQISPAKSFFCENTITITSSTGSYTAQVDTNVSGLLPTTAGLDKVIIKNYISNGKAVINVGLSRSLSFVDFGAKLSGDTVNYNVSFYNSSGGIMNNVNFMIKLIDKNGTVLNESGGTASGVFSSSISSSSPPPYLIMIFPISHSEVFSTCV